MPINIDYLKKKLHTLDKDALGDLRRMLMTPYMIKEIKQARDAVQKGVSIGMDENIKSIRKGPFTEDAKEKLETCCMFLELNLAGVVDNVVEENIKELIGEIDNILLEMSKK